MRAPGRISIIVLLAVGTSVARPAKSMTLDDFERASAIVIGRLQNVQRLDRYSYTALLRLDRVLEGVAPGPPMRLLWEQELATRPPNFYDGDDVLVAVNGLAPVADAGADPAFNSLGGAFEIAAAGEAYVRLPDPQSSYLLISYLSLSPAERLARIGVTALARLVASAALELREAALDRLGKIDELRAKLSPDARQMLLLVVSDEDQPRAIRESVLTLIGQRKLRQLRNDLTSLLRKKSSVKPAMLDAIAALDDGLPWNLVERSLDDRDPNVRAAAVRGASFDSIVERLPEILRSDPSPTVRAEAARTLVRRGGPAELQLAGEGLWDTDIAVRKAAAREIGKRHAAAIALLRRVAWSGSDSAAEAAVLGLAFSSAVGQPVLRRIAAEHPVAEVRRLATLAILRF